MPYEEPDYACPLIDSTISAVHTALEEIEEVRDRCVELREWGQSWVDEAEEWEEKANEYKQAADELRDTLEEAEEEIERLKQELAGKSWLERIPLLGGI